MTKTAFVVAVPHLDRTLVPRGCDAHVAAAFAPNCRHHIVLAPSVTVSGDERADVTCRLVRHDKRRAGTCPLRSHQAQDNGLQQEQPADGMLHDESFKASSSVASNTS